MADQALEQFAQGYGEISWRFSQTDYGEDPGKQRGPISSKGLHQVTS